MCRPAPNQRQQRPSPGALFSHPTSTASPDRDSLKRVDNTPRLRQSLWSNSQISDKPAKTRLERSATCKTKKSETEPTSPTHARAFSFSSLDDSPNRSTETKDGILRIVIDRSAAPRPKTAEENIPSTLEIPIPHYRLGQPHFSLQGTPVFRSSTHTRTSGEMSDNLKPTINVKNDLLSPAQAAMNRRGLSESHPSDRFLSPSGTMTDISRDSTGAATNYSYREPIDPAVFDRLATFRNSATVVRYSQKTGAITAATPARIVAQISSESFMDYELVSDFFLTFRAYLSTENLLALLLARLRWAINRLEDDGRIIRIRTFAALRHWILNYFVDDFVVNRNLRVQFCDQINEMYHEISKRTGGGVSDLKILLDLKRCWNGRCSLYWDSTDFVADTHQDADIVPGGVLGSRDASLTQLDVVPDQEIEAMTRSRAEKPSLPETWYGQPPAAACPNVHNTQASISSVGAPLSPTSEQSLQPASCSIPARAFKRSPAPDGNARGPYPVTLQLRKENPAANPPILMTESQRRLSHAHKRAASTSDSIRDHELTNPLSRPQLLANPYTGSLIRGNVYPPSPPFVDVIAPESPPCQRSRLNASPSRLPVSCESLAKPGSSANPGVKTIMGSIRRALSSKQGVSTSASSVDDSSRSAPSLRGKTSGLPLNMARSTDTLREKKSAPGPKHHLRIDLLCAAVSQSYQMAQTKASQDSSVNHGLGVSISNVHEDSASQRSLGSRDFSIEAGDVHCTLTEELGPTASAMSDDATELAASSTRMALRGDVQEEVRIADVDFKALGMTSMPLLSTERQENRNNPCWRDQRRSSSVDTALARRSKGQGQLYEREPLVSLEDGVLGRTSHLGHDRKPKSVDLIASGALQYETGHPVDGAVTSISEILSESVVNSRGPAHNLRRRPGGNLRDIENVNDLAPVLRRQSTGSLTARSESVGSMLVIGGNRTTGPKQKRSVTQATQHPISLIHTHSSQQLRPSFEAAISGFSKIPDDEDGGLEATLLKLEGRYKRASHRKPSHSRLSSHHSNSRRVHPGSVSKKREPGTKSVSTRSGRSKSSAADSEGSYSSIPLLERGLTDGSMKKPRTVGQVTSKSNVPHLSVENQLSIDVKQVSTSSHPSIEVVEKTDSMNRIPQGSTLPNPRPPTSAGSFLLDEDDNLTDLSSELSGDATEHLEPEHPVVANVFPAPENSTPGHDLPLHPLAHPPSPAFSFHHAIASVAPVNPMMFQQQPLTPRPSPTQGDIAQGSQMQDLRRLPKRKSVAIGSATITSSAGHIPFILACESEILAQQFTLVEKAALSEIDWSDLVDMKWDNKSPNILNWVDYLVAREHRGIDIVVARFNIVVKWVLSEIVMTRDLHERANTLTKYIHIAGHARRIHNYATMVQITIALTSIDCTRLKATWELIPELEKTLLKEMETLIQPIRNFHDLRIEMETANLQDGCIPFVGMYPLFLTTISVTNKASLGLYVHDLTYNAQKPSKISSTLDGEPLVNFEKYRTTATIVKSLLRLIDASSRYNFAPIPGIIDRCLWMAALSDDKITALSKSIEQ